MQEILKILPKWACENIINAIKHQQLYEIRMAVNQPMVLIGSHTHFQTCYDHICTYKDIADIIIAAAEYSLYSYSDEIKQGFITIKGGHRIGFSGKAVYDNEKIQYIEQFQSICIRIATQNDYVNPVFEKALLYDPFVSTLIVGPPGCGKTTIIRQAARQLSKKYKVAIVDERDEIAAEQNLGPGAFVYSRFDKKSAAQMAIRSMSPNFILFDEIAGDKDAQTILNCSKSGCIVYATAHAFSSQTRLQLQKQYKWCGRFAVMSQNNFKINIFEQ